ncbi:MAG: hypothetical protein SXQ77_04060, partial [Halobacteria archaeon]|nr:hypothetical protein [Halobacteria archaeon]
MSTMFSPAVLATTDVGMDSTYAATGNQAVDTGTGTGNQAGETVEITQTTDTGKTALELKQEAISTLEDTNLLRRDSLFRYAGYSERGLEEVSGVESGSGSHDGGGCAQRVG